MNSKYFDFAQVSLSMLVATYIDRFLKYTVEVERVGESFRVNFYRKTPLLVPGVDPFLDANIYASVQLIAETKTDLESSTSPLLSPILH
jgi:hypothetical protein